MVFTKTLNGFAKGAGEISYAISQAVLTARERESVCVKVKEHHATMETANTSNELVMLRAYLQNLKKKKIHLAFLSLLYSSVCNK